MAIATVTANRQYSCLLQQTLKQNRMHQTVPSPSTAIPLQHMHVYTLLKALKQNKKFSILYVTMLRKKFPQSAQRAFGGMRGASVDINESPGIYPIGCSHTFEVIFWNPNNYVRLP